MNTKIFNTSKKIVGISCILLALAGGRSIAQQIQITVIVKNIKTDEGDVLLAVYNSDKTFLKEKYRTETVKAKKGEVTIILKGIPPGEYAFAVVHDQDGNGKFNSNWFGMPIEGFGFSNDARGFMGAPSFTKAKVVLENVADGHVASIRTISMKYLR